MPFTHTGLEALAWTPAAVSILVVATRIIVRTKTQAIAADDYLMLIALMWFICYATLKTTIYSTNAVTDFEIAQQTTIQTMATIVAYLSVHFGRTSVGILLLRLLSPSMFLHRLFIWLTLAGLQIITFLVLVANFLPYCTEAVMASPDMVGCMTPEIFIGFAQTWNFYGVFVDLAFSTLPIFMMSKLNMRGGRRAVLAVVLGLGWLAGIFLLLRAISLYTSWTPATTSMVIAVATSMEQGLIIICGSLATMMPLYKFLTTGKAIRPRNHLVSPTYDSDTKYPFLAKNSTSTMGAVRSGSRKKSMDESMPGIRVDRQFDIVSAPKDASSA